MKTTELKYRIDVTSENKNHYKQQIAYEMLMGLGIFRSTSAEYPYKVKIGEFDYSISDIAGRITVNGDNLYDNYGSRTTGIVGHMEEWNLTVRQQGAYYFFGPIDGTFDILARPHYDMLIQKRSVAATDSPPSSFTLYLYDMEADTVKTYSWTSSDNGLYFNTWPNKSVAKPYVKHYPIARTSSERYTLDGLLAFILKTEDEELLKHYPFFYVEDLYDAIVTNLEFSVGDVITIMEQDFYVLTKSESRCLLIRC